MTLSAASTGARSVAVHRPPKFLKEDTFRHDLDRRVDAYFASTGHRRRDIPAMYSKTAFILVWTAGCWATLLFAPLPWWLPIPMAIALGLGVAAIGMAVMHDANHSGYSRWPWVNRLFGWTLDTLGCSSHIWKTKHNTVHHTWTNVVGVDDDLEVGPLARLAPGQRWRPWHRAQHVYMFVLYAFLLPKWVVFDDFYNLATRRVGATALPMPSPLEWAVLVGGKIVFLTWSLVLPILLHPVLAVLGLWLLAASTVGVVLSTTFQLAHCAQGAEFAEPGEPLHRDWAEHQLATTIDFAPGSRWLTWFMGGLNYQVVHHLFPRVCHLNYPAMAKIVAETAAEHGLVYHQGLPLREAIAAHLHWLQQMGCPPRDRRDLIAQGGAKG